MSIDDEPTETIGEFVEVEWDDDDVVAMPTSQLDECEQVVCLMAHVANLGAKVSFSGTASTGRRCEIERTLEGGVGLAYTHGRGATFLQALEEAAELMREQMDAEDVAQRVEQLRKITRGA